MMPIIRKSQMDNAYLLIKNLERKKFKINLFDVSLRDGLQSKNKVYSLDEKKNILHDIINKFDPKSIEIGSLVSKKILPQMGNSIELYQYAKKLNKKTNFFMLIPNLNYTKKAIKNNIENLSFITSISNDFQMKNVNKTLDETKKELILISEYIKNKNIKNTKLYISCINICPIFGILNNNFIINEILYYNKLNCFDELCLSDTCGNLEFNNFKIIIDSIIDQIDSCKLSLHLHVSDNYDNIKKIIHYSLEKNINNFDISILNDGGCSVTIQKDKLNNNLTYEILEKILNNQ